MVVLMSQIQKCFGLGAMQAISWLLLGCTASAPAGSGAGATADASGAVTDAVAQSDTAAATSANSASDATADLVAAETAAADATGKATPWGTITGACGTLGPALASADPSFWVNTYNFNSSNFDPSALRAFAAKRFSGPNAGGSSKCSEAMSMQLLSDCEGIAGYKTEVEIQFTATGPNTDWEGIWNGTKLGVSVSRAYLGPTKTTYTEADATTLLTKKLNGINASTLTVAPADKWAKQILHIWTLRPDWVPVVQAAWAKLDAKLRADTVVVVTVEVGSTAITADTCAK